MSYKLGFGIQWLNGLRLFHIRQICGKPLQVAWMRHVVLRRLSRTLFGQSRKAFSRVEVEVDVGD